MTMRTFDSFLLAAVACILVGCGSGGGGSSSGGPASPSVGTETRTFTNTGFTEVEIRNSFAFIVQEGDHFAIEVTVCATQLQPNQPLFSRSSPRVICRLPSATMVLAAAGCRSPRLARRISSARR